MDCAFPDGDISCDENTQEQDNIDTIYYGTSVKTASGTCNVVERTNRNEAGKVTMEKVPCPIKCRETNGAKSKEISRAARMTRAKSRACRLFYQDLINSTIFSRSPSMISTIKPY